jgi:uncharacterized phiE125 gp8 family phage protein
MFADIQIIDQPLILPVDLAEFKKQAGIVDLGENDEMLQTMLAAAVDRCEGYLRQSLITQTLDIWWDTWDGPGIIENIPRGPIQTVVGLYTYDDGGIPTTVETSTYAIQGTTLLFNTWPPYFRPYRGLRMRVIAGFGDDPEDVPATIRQGILEYATSLYDTRLGEGSSVKFSEQANMAGALPPGVVDKWRRYQKIYV